MKRKILAFLIAGAIALSAIPAVSAETNEGVATESTDVVVATLERGELTLTDALEILRFVVGLPSVLNECDDALAAALIVSEDVPGIVDALQIMRHLVGLESVLD
jgi:hypothetical protein